MAGIFNGQLSFEQKPDVGIRIAYNSDGNTLVFHFWINSWIFSIAFDHERSSKFSTITCQQITSNGAIYYLRLFLKPAIIKILIMNSFVRGPLAAACRLLRVEKRRKNTDGKWDLTDLM